MLILWGRTLENVLTNYFSIFSECFPSTESLSPCQCGLLAIRRDARCVEELWSLSEHLTSQRLSICLDGCLHFLAFQIAEGVPRMRRNDVGTVFWHRSKQRRMLRPWLFSMLWIMWVPAPNCRTFPTRLLIRHRKSKCPLPMGLNPFNTIFSNEVIVNN